MILVQESKGNTGRLLDAIIVQPSMAIGKRIRRHWSVYVSGPRQCGKNVRRRGPANAFSGGGWYPNTPPKNQSVLAPRAFWLS